MLSKEMLQRIEEGEINSRRQLYKVVGRSKKLLQWLNDNNILVPNVWTKEMFNTELKKIGNIRANENWNMFRLAKRFYGTWNNALEEVLGVVNQHRYENLSNERLKQVVVDYVKKFKRLPLRSEFDGSSYETPYWETIVKRLGVKKWSDVFGLIDLSNVQYYHDKKHGTGKVHILDGVVYLSHQEYIIGKYLTENNISFEKEIPYKNCGYVFDFYLKDFDVYIEYYGMETDEYKQRIQEKRKFYNNRKVLEIFKHDNTIKKLDFEVQRL